METVSESAGQQLHTCPFVRTEAHLLFTSSIDSRESFCLDYATTLRDPG